MHYEARKIHLDLNIFDAKGNVIGARDVEITPERISDIIDHAVQLIILRTQGSNLDDVLEDLKEALFVSDVLGDSNSEEVAR